MTRTNAMIIVCEKCGTKFKVSDEKIKPGGVKVRCSKCKAIFKVFPSEPPSSPKTNGVNLNFNLEEDPTVKTKGPKIDTEDLGFEIEIDLPEPEETEKIKPKKKASNLSAEDLGLDLKTSPKIKMNKPPAPSVESEPESGIPANLDALDPIDEAPITQKPAANSKAPKIQAIDQGLDKILQEPDQEQPLPSHSKNLDSPFDSSMKTSFGEDPFGDPSDDLSQDPSLEDPSPSIEDEIQQIESPESNIPLTMPSDIDLNSLAGENQSPGRGLSFNEIDDQPPADPTQEPFEEELQDPLLKGPPKKITEDGIELVGSSRPEKEESIPLERDTLPPDLTPSQARRVPQSLPKRSSRKISSPTFSFHEEKKSNFGRFVSFVLFLALILGGSTAYILKQVHGEVDFKKLDLATFIQFIQTLQSPGTSQTLTKENQDTQFITIHHTTTHLVKNADDKNILIINGDVKNEYEIKRSFIRVKVEIFSTQGKLISEKEVWAGNKFTRSEIYNFTNQKTIDGSYINAGKKLSNLDIEPGNSVPFQIIIFNPPEDWKEFKVMVTSSQPAA